MDLTICNQWAQFIFVSLLIILRNCLSIDDLEYLTKYGYLQETDDHSDNLLSETYLKKAVSSFQRMAGLPVTGIIDPETKHMMDLPRCGVKDFPVGTGYRARRRRRRRRYALHGSKWQRNVITYRIRQPSRKLSLADVQNELQRAFDIWSEVIPLTFVRKEFGAVDIEIKFVAGRHDDNTPFDGNGQTLAHAYFPQYGGDAHFDEDERWTVGYPEGVNLFQVAAHEFGHSLGLAHSDVRTALMAPFYRGYDRNFKLDQDDILAVQELYGTKEEVTSPVPQIPSTYLPMVSIPVVCRNATVDAITRTDDGITYMFKGEYYFRLNEKSYDSGYPRVIEWDWESVKGPIDAALTWPNGWTFIFKGDSYWKFHNMRMIYGPKNISEGFDGIPSNIDAAFVWSGNGKTYFIKDNLYWRYYGNRIDQGYPKSLSIWRGLPKKISAAFQYKNGRTYFFSGDLYYRYNDQDFDVDSANGGYPKEVAAMWLGCPNKDKIKEYDSMQGRKPDVFFGTLNGRSRHDDEQWITVQEDPSYESGLKQSSWNNGASALTHFNTHILYASSFCLHIWLIYDRFKR